MPNSPRIDSLLRAGNLYLSLQDAIALALENNLDIAIQRYGPQIADAVVMSCRSGRFRARRFDHVTAGPAGANGKRLWNHARQQPERLIAGQHGNLVARSAAACCNRPGPRIPSLDPMLTGSLSWAHQTTPQSNAFITGTNSLISAPGSSATWASRRDFSRERSSGWD